MRRLTPLAACVLALGACSSTPAATDVLSRAAGSLGSIRSGELHLRVVVETAPGEGSSRIGFMLDGPFSLGDPGELPEARITYTQLAGDDEATVTLTSTGETAYQTVAGQTTEMGEEQLAALRAAGGSDEGSGFEQLDVGDWIDQPELNDGGSKDGVECHLVTGRLDAVAALNGMVGAAQAFGSGTAGLEQLGPADARVIEGAMKSSSVGVYAGEEDGLLRELDLLVDFRADAGKEVLDALGPLSGARFTLELMIEDPNSPIDVEAPPEVSGSSP